MSINLIVGSYMVASTKTLNFISATVHEINRGNQHSKKETIQNIPILKTSTRNKHPRDLRLIDYMVGSTKI